MNELPNCYRCGAQPCECSDGLTIYHGDCLDILPLLEAGSFELVLTDPPYGISHASNRPGAPQRGRQIANDDSVRIRDIVLDWHCGPWVVFGTCKMPAPNGYRGVLVWDKGGHVGMGDLSLPWKQNWEHIYIGGEGFKGRRNSGVLRFNAIAPWANRITHPHEKPLALICELLNKCPPGTVLDPFLGSGTTLRACKDLGRRGVGIEISQKYCEIAAKRLEQGVLF